MLQHLNSLLSTRSRLHTQLLSYNTTFNFGDFYISGLLFRCICFHENPVLLGLFMMHERKLRSTHKMFVEVLGDKVPALNNSNSVLVTDGELSFEVFEDKFPKLNKIFCWNHVLFSETVAAQPQCVSRRREGVRRSHPWASACDDSDRLQSTIRWKDPIVSQSFKTYYDDEIDRHIGKSFGRVVLTRLDVYDVNSGVTQNMSEGFNTVMQHNDVLIYVWILYSYVQITFVSPHSVGEVMKDTANKRIKIRRQLLKISVRYTEFLCKKIVWN